MTEPFAAVVAVKKNDFMNMKKQGNVATLAVNIKACFTQARECKSCLLTLQFINPCTALLQINNHTEEQFH